jgi:5-methyltetrahydrofolate--homocysteine methyltransferase
MSKDNVIQTEAARRILILDGAMGSMIHSLYPGYDGISDELCLTKPDLISSIHREYLEVGADIIETCSFNSTPLSLAPYGLGDRAAEISGTAAALARAAADAYSTAEKPRFVAGSMGPTAKSASIPQDPMDPAKRAVSWDELEASYYENARGLFDHVDLFLIETIFDTLNAKAAVAALLRLFEERGREKPIMVSATVSESGSLLTGQTSEDFFTALSHGPPFSAGLNCSFGADKMLPHIRKLAGALPCLVSVYPNAGLPDSKGRYSDTPEMMAASLELFFKEGLVNIAGGCCGSTPAHIAAIAAAAAKYRPRAAADSRADGSGPSPGADGQNPGAEVLSTVKNAPAPGEKEFLALVGSGDYDGAAELLEELPGDCIKLYFDDSVPEAEKTIGEFMKHALFFPGIAKRQLVIKSPRWEITEAALKCLPGRAFVDGELFGQFSGEALCSAARRYGALVIH